jgi:Zn finger protein HypA/HybF involved in hydrogenase expression
MSESEIIKCYKCGQDFEAHHGDFGSYFCPHCEKPKDDKQKLEEAFKYLDQVKKL